MTGDHSPTSLCFDQLLQPEGVLHRDCEILPRAPRPFLRGARTRLEQVSNREAGAQQTAVAAIEVEQRRRRRVVHFLHCAAIDRRAHGCRSEPLALERKKRQLIDRVQAAQPGVELQAVDDANAVVEPNVLGSQVTMRIDESSLADATTDLFPARLKVVPLCGRNATHKMGWQAESGFQQDPAIGDRGLAHLIELNDVTQIRTLRSRIEIGKPVCQTVDVPCRNAFFRDCVLERLAFGQAAHHDEPINDPSRAVDANSLPAKTHGHDIQINVGCEPAIELQLDVAELLPALQCREIEVGKAHGLLELVGAVANEKDPRHVGFANIDASGRKSALQVVAKPSDLFLSRRIRLEIITGDDGLRPCRAMFSCWFVAAHNQRSPPGIHDGVASRPTYDYAMCDPHQRTSIRDWRGNRSVRMRRLEDASEKRP